MSIAIKHVGVGSNLIIYAKFVEEKDANIQESIKIAHKAIGLDLSDSYSWCTSYVSFLIDLLGNAYLANFFTNLNSFEDLNNALKAYHQSVLVSIRD